MKISALYVAATSFSEVSIQSLWTVLVLFPLVIAVSPVDAAESKQYSAPRFPSYLRPPKSIDDIMPFACAVVRQTDSEGANMYLEMTEEKVCDGDLQEGRRRQL